jgi:hypothetical protein
MRETPPLTCDSINLPNPREVALAKASPIAEELDILNDDVMIDVASDRPRGTIRVKLVYVGRSTPIPADDPSAG